MSSKIDHVLQLTKRDARACCDARDVKGRRLDVLLLYQLNIVQRCLAVCANLLLLSVVLLLLCKFEFIHTARCLKVLEANFNESLFLAASARPLHCLSSTYCIFE